MLIEKSPFHPTNHRVNRIDVDKNKFEVQDGIEKNIKEGKDSFSIIKWIKGVINPLENLPIVSGIYSSINSDDSESDRDMVQNGLGGLLYGGPIGAIVGVGNWVFNKIFDNTPTEMFFSMTGISNMWKEKPEEEKKLVSSFENVNDKKTVYLVEPTTKTQNKSLENFSKTVKPKIIEKVETLNQKSFSIKNSISDDTLNDVKQKKFEFDYPKWKPENQDFINKKNKNLSMINNIYRMENIKLNNIKINA